MIGINHFNINIITTPTHPMHNIAFDDCHKVRMLVEFIPNFDRCHHSLVLDLVLQPDRNKNIAAVDLRLLC